MKRKIFRCLLALLFMPAMYQTLSAQIELAGPIYVFPNTVVKYTVSFPYPQPANTTIMVEVTEGFLIGPSAIPVIGSNTVYDFYVEWPDHLGIGKVEVYDDVNFSYESLEIYIEPTLEPGSIATSYPHYNQTVSHAAITATPSIGGHCMEEYSYSWERSTDGTSWTTFGTSLAYPSSAPPITERTFIRRRTDCLVHTVYTNVLEFTYRSATWVDENFIRVNDIWYPGITTLEEADALPIGQKQQSIIYYDGLGRPEQTVLMQVTPAGKDLVTPHVYDDLGRDTRKMLPYEASTRDGTFKQDALAAQQAFMSDPVTGKYIGESQFYSETILENSPLARPVKALAPGASWGGNDKGVENNYDLNVPGENIRIWKIDALSIGTIPTTAGVYPAYTLQKITTTDEEGRQATEYRDTEGRCILKKHQEKSAGAGLTQAHAGWLCTYYIYDDIGMLRFVIPPKAVSKLDQSENWTISPELAYGLCYSYTYDGKERMIEKKLPGIEPVQMVYDVRDRLVLSQDGNQAAGTGDVNNYKEWNFFLYDDLNRQVVAGTLLESNSYSRHSMQIIADQSSGSGIENTNVSIQTNISEILTVNRPLPIFTTGPITIQSKTINQVFYYDQQNANQYIPVTHAYPDNFENIETASPSDRTKGLQTGYKTRVLDGNNTFLPTSIIYDNRGRELQTHNNSLYNHNLTQSNQYDFSGKLRSSKFTDFLQNTHTNPVPGGGSFTVDYIVEVQTKNEFDHNGRLTKLYKNLRRKEGHPLISHEIDISTGEKLVAAYDYDEWGKIKTRTLAPGYDGRYGAWIEKLEYEYNIRGWLAGINRPYVQATSANGSFFGMEIGYDKSGDAGFTGSLLDGNIAGTSWKTTSDNISRKYDYQYDLASRLVNADFNQSNGSAGSWVKNAFDFSVPVINYDENGNITRMEQQGVVFAGIVPMDRLSYGYGATDNKLQWVAEDAGPQNYGLGDFTDKNTGAGNFDFMYDANGNLIKDNNKGISSIRYNHLNLPEMIEVTDKGTVQFIYDATGKKLAKKITDQTSGNGPQENEIIYFGPVTYDQGAISVNFEEGRARFIRDHEYFAFDYFVKDHLGNVRMVLTDEETVNAYPPATMETNMAQTEDSYYNITDRSDLPIELQGNTQYTNRYGSKMSKLSSLTEAKKIGPSILLKVMAGDVVHAKTDYYYKDNGTQVNSNSFLSDLVSNLLTHITLGQAGPAAKAEAALIGTNTANDAIVNALISRQNDDYNSSKPKAHLNYIIFDEQMKAVGSGTRQVAASGPLQSALIFTDIEIEKHGYIYVFVNNESQQPVYFDNFQVTHAPGNILEETHYYPFGLTMMGISSKAAGKLDNRYKYNGKEKQEKEFSDGSGLEWYDYGTRMYEPQTGRWFVVDPLAEVQPNKTPYHYTSNNPINRIDPTGMLDEPTPKEAAMLAKYVYGDKNDPGYLIGGWKVSNVGKDLKLTNEESGFKSGVYERTTNGVTEYVYATAGTDDWQDVKHDVLQPLGMSSQYKESLNNVEALKNIIGDAELTFTGHSLGGGLAENNSLKTGDKAITFNAAGVSFLTSGTLNKSNTDAYIMTTDPLNALQQATSIPTAGGKKHWLQPRSASGIYNGHSINSVIEALSKPTIGQQINNGLRRALTPPQFRF